MLETLKDNDVIANWIKELEESKKRQRQKIISLESQLRYKEIAKKKFKAQLDEKEELISELRREVESATKLQKYQKSLVDELAAEKENILREKDGKISKLRAEKEKLKGILDAKELKLKETEDLEDELNGLSHDLLVKDLQSEMTATHERERQLLLGHKNKQIDAWNSELNKVKEALKESDEIHNQNHRSIAAKTEEIVALRKRLQELQEQFDLEEECHRFSHEMLLEDLEFEMLRKHKKELKRLTEQRNQEVSTLDSELIKAVKALGETDQELNKIRGQSSLFITSKNKELLALKKKVRELEKKLKCSEYQRFEWEKATKVLGKDKNELESKAARIETELNSALKVIDGKDLESACDEIIHDKLVEDELSELKLDNLKKSQERSFCFKEWKKHEQMSEERNATLVEERKIHCNQLESFRLEKVKETLKLNAAIAELKTLQSKLSDEKKKSEESAAKAKRDRDAQASEHRLQMKSVENDKHELNSLLTEVLDELEKSKDEEKNRSEVIEAEDNLKLKSDLLDCQKELERKVGMMQDRINALEAECSKKEHEVKQIKGQMEAKIAKSEENDDELRRFREENQQKGEQIIGSHLDSVVDRVAARETLTKTKGHLKIKLKRLKK